QFFHFHSVRLFIANSYSCLGGGGFPAYITDRWTFGPFVLNREGSAKSLSKKWLIAAVMVCFMLCIHLTAVFAAEESDSSTSLPFILRNENFAFHERTAAVIIDAGKEVDGASLSAADFDVHVLQ